METPGPPEDGNSWSPGGWKLLVPRRMETPGPVA